MAEIPVQVLLPSGRRQLVESLAVRVLANPTHLPSDLFAACPARALSGGEGKKAPERVVGAVQLRLRVPWDRGLSRAAQ